MLLKKFKVQVTEPFLFRSRLSQAELRDIFAGNYASSSPEESLDVFTAFEKVARENVKKKEREKESPKKIVLDTRSTVPGLLKDFKPGVYIPPKDKPLSPHKGTPQEYRCRDCKKPFCRKGDRDNHEKRLGHEKWRKGFSLQLNLE